jgi:hypothetical protein
MQHLARLAPAVALCLLSPMTTPVNAAPAAYFDSSGRDDVLSGGAKTITIQTPKGPFRVWTKRVGNNPRILAQRLSALRQKFRERLPIVQMPAPGERDTVPIGKAPMLEVELRFATLGR